MAVYLWYSVLAFRSSMLMSGRPDSSSSSSCSLKIAISLKNGDLSIRRINRNIVLTFWEWCHKIPQGRQITASWSLQSSSFDRPAWCNPACSHRWPEYKALNSLRGNINGIVTHNNVSPVSNQITDFSDAKLLNLRGEGQIISEISNLRNFLEIVFGTEYW